MSPSLPRRAFIAALAAVSLAACGSTQTPAPAAQQQPASGTSAASAFPVTIEHKFGKTEIKAEPKRVVTLGLTDQEAVLAMGVKPVGVVDWFGERPYGNFPWTSALWGGTQPEIVGERGDFNFEKIAALKPDVIIAQYQALSQEQYDTVSKIAPTVAQSGKYPDFATPWRDMTRTIGQTLGRAAKAEELLSGIEAKFAQVRKENPDFVGKTVAVADTTGPGKYAVFAANDPRSVLMTEIGFKIPDQVKSLTQDGNPVEFGDEKLDLLEADRLIWLTSDDAAPDQIKANAVYQKLKVAQEGRAVFVPYNTPPAGAAVTFATVLSIPYALDQVVPLLAAVKK
ncbi:iron-siderophore ABC transporter substrate-binding protein [Actinocrispum sp. NPDC049592]|uniref:iron-siderophore ABC transporter substrate-binding protein n=1 Tax=Actinocrispum sp. NPDC049592 TaxID=3154835 RepID=UPI003416E1EF